MVIGGKIGKMESTSAFTRSVIGFDLFFELDPRLREKQEDYKDSNKKWIDYEDLICARANFGLIVLDNLVYVFGGISKAVLPQKDSKSEPYIPVMSGPAVECFNPKLNKWSEIKINNMPSIGAFSWCSISNSNPEKILIVGGTDGEVL